MKRIAIIIVMAAMMFIAAGMASAEVCKSASVAEKFVEMGEISSAIACYNNMKNADPDEKYYFRLGELYLLIDQESSATEMWKSAPVRSKYSDKIATAWVKQGDKMVGLGKWDWAEKCYLNAVEVKPIIQGQIADALISDGKRLNSQKLFDLAVAIDPASGAKISAFAKTQCEGKKNGDQISCMEEFVKYDSAIEINVNDLRERLGRFHLGELKKYAKIIGKDKVADDHRKAATKFLGKETVEKEAPSIRIFPPSNDWYVFEIPVGEQTPYQIAHPEGRKNKWRTDPDFDKKCDYKVIYDDQDGHYEATKDEITPKRRWARYRYNCLSSSIDGQGCIIKLKVQ